MKIVLAGASGRIGRRLVPLLKNNGVDLLILGRSKNMLLRMFPDCEVATYQEIETKARGADLLVNLAVLNNDSDAPYDDFKLVNVDLALDIFRIASDIGIRSYMYVSSIHALDEHNGSYYAKSKRTGIEALKKISGAKLHVVYLAAVFEEPLAGRLAALDSIPGPLRQLILAMLSALRPTVRIEHIGRTILECAADTGTEGRSVIVTNGQANNACYAVVKRCIDLGFALSCVILLWWVMVVVWLLVRITSPGPGLFRQQRIGKNEQVFDCYKFRTMFVDTRNAATHQVSASAVTPIGHFLRRTKLDELPQVFNILLNQMSLVGPRPCLPSQDGLIEERRSRGVFEIKPGITGLGQIRGVDMSDPVRLARLDREYLDLQSLTLDWKIIVSTAKGNGGGDNVKLTGQAD